MSVGVYDIFHSVSVLPLSNLNYSDLDRVISWLPFWGKIHQSITPFELLLRCQTLDGKQKFLNFILRMNVVPIRSSSYREHRLERGLVSAF